jgi:hypothetical protein
MPLTRIRIHNRQLPAQRTLVLFIRLHDDQTPDAEDVPAAQLHRPPLQLHAHGARVVVEQRHVRNHRRVDLRAHGFCEVLGKLGELDLLGEGRFHAQCGLLVEF